MDSGRRYILPMVEQAISNGDEDLFEIVAPSDACVVVEELVIGEAASETALQVSLSWVKGNTSSGNGTSVTPTPVQTGDAAFGGTCERNGTTVASGGSPVTLPVEPFDIRAGMRWVPTPGYRIVLSPGERLCLRQSTAPGATWTGSGYASLREIGG